MAYPTAEEIRSLLPGEGQGVELSEISLFIGDWKARVADGAGLQEAPEGDPYAEMIVRRGACGDAYKQMLLADFHNETPAADNMIRQAETMLARFDERKSTKDEPGSVRSHLVSNVTRRPIWDERRSNPSYSPGGASPLSDHIDDNW